MIRALLVDDEAPARSELRYLLATHPEVEVVGEQRTDHAAGTCSRTTVPNTPDFSRTPSP